MGFYALKTFIKSLSGNCSDGSISKSDAADGYTALVTAMQSELVSNSKRYIHLRNSVLEKAEKKKAAFKTAKMRHIQIFRSHS